jgi:hypothetical protein
MMNRQENNVDEKLAQELILYICHKLESSPGFGATVLNKALYYIDHSYYVSFEKKLTGFKYVKQQFGPTPKPSEFLPICSSLFAKNRIEEKSVEFFGRRQKRFCALEMPDLTVFRSEEIALIDSVIDTISNHHGTSISNASHEELGWKLAKMMEEIPPFAYLLTETELNQNDVDWAIKTIHEYSPSSGIRQGA